MVELLELRSQTYESREAAELLLFVDGVALGCRLSQL